MTFIADVEFNQNVKDYILREINLIIKLILISICILSIDIMSVLI